MTREEILDLAIQLANETFEDAKQQGLVLDNTFKTAYEAGIIKGISHMIKQKDNEEG